MQWYYKCMTKQNKNSVRDYSNAVLVRSEADSNRCRRFCRPLVKPLAHQTVYLRLKEINTMKRLTPPIEVQIYTLFLNLQNFSTKISKLPASILQKVLFLQRSKGVIPINMGLSLLDSPLSAVICISPPILLIINRLCYRFAR